MARVWIPGTTGDGYYLDVPDDVAAEINSNPGRANQIAAEYLREKSYSGPTTAIPRSRGIVDEPEGSPAATVRKEAIERANTSGLQGSKFRSIINPEDLTVSPWQNKAPVIMNRGNEESARQRAVDSIKRKLQPVPDYEYNTAKPSIPASRKIDFSGSVDNRNVGMSPIQSRIIAKRFSRDEPNVSPMAPAKVSENYQPKVSTSEEVMAAPAITQQPELTAKQFSREQVNVQPMTAPSVSLGFTSNEQEEALKRAIKNRLRMA